MGLRRELQLARLAVAGLLLVLAGAAAARPEPKVVRELHYGEGLFYFYQDDYFTAITRLLAAREQGRIVEHEEDSELLLGGLYLSYGQHDEASAIFERLLDESVREPVRDRAWLALARIAYQRAHPDGASSALAQIGDSLERDQEAQRYMLAGQILIEQRRFEEAIAVLENWKAPADWRDYARFNLGVALIRHGRTDDGTRLLEKIGTRGSDAQVPQKLGWPSRIFMPWRALKRRARHPIVEYDETLALRDKANLALGFAYLQASAPEQAASSLRRVSLEGPWSTKALLGTGWAEAELGNYEQALSPWVQLQARDRLDPAVQESLLAVPYALSMLQSHDEAVHRYHTAIDAFNGEITLLDERAATLDNGRFLQQLIGQDALTEMGWFWQLAELPDTPETRYLYHLLADHGFQEGLKNYRDLLLLRDNLERWHTGVAAFADMLETRERRYLRRLALMDASLERERLQALELRARALAERVDAIAAQRDLLGLANAEELDAWQRLVEIEQRLASLPESPQLEQVRHKHGLLRGVLLWRLSYEHSARLWEQRKAMRDLESAVEEARERRASLAQAREGLQQGFETFHVRVAAIRPRIVVMQARVDEQLLAHERYLEGLTLGQLEAQKSRLRAYLTEAQYALASAYDRASRAGGGQP